MRPERRSTAAVRVAAGEFYSFTATSQIHKQIRHNHSYGTAKPNVWGFHDYYDPRKPQASPEDHVENMDLEKFLKEIKGFPAPESGSARQGWLLQNGSKATKLKTSAEHARLQVSAANDILKLANGHSRIELVDYYLYEGPTSKYDKEPENLTHSTVRSWRAQESRKNRNHARLIACSCWDKPRAVLPAALPKHPQGTA